MNKQIIIRILISFVFSAFALRILIPVLYNFFKLKISGQNNHNDLDQMIRRQQDRLRTQYGITIQSKSANNNAPSNSQQLVHTNFSNEILKNILSNYGYSINENKINTFLSLAEKRHLLNFLPEKYRNSTENKVLFLSQCLLMNILVDENIKKSFTMSQFIAKKLSLSIFEFTIGIQIKVLLHMKNVHNTEDKVFSDQYILKDFSEEIINNSINSIIQKEATLWAQSSSLLFEELSLYFHYASILLPLPVIQNKQDFESAALILHCKSTDSIEVIKKNYKRIALEKHPDKITAQKLPPKLEQQGLTNFNKIQEAYEILSKYKK